MDGQPSPRPVSKRCSGRSPFVSVVEATDFGDRDDPASGAVGHRSVIRRALLAATCQRDAAADQDEPVEHGPIVVGGRAGNQHDLVVASVTMAGGSGPVRCFTTQ